MLHFTRGSSWGRLPYLNLQFSCASYAQASKGVKSGGKPLPQKQQFRKRFKDAKAATVSQTGEGSQATHREALTDALFKVTNEQEPPTPRTDSDMIEQRAFISKAWSRWQMVKLHGQSGWEKALLESKINAMQELRKVSPELAQAANVIDYSIPPAHRRVPTETPPDPTKFPFIMTSSW